MQPPTSRPTKFSIKLCCWTAVQCSLETNQRRKRKKQTPPYPTRPCEHECVLIVFTRSGCLSGVPALPLAMPPLISLHSTDGAPHKKHQTDGMCVCVCMWLLNQSCCTQLNRTRRCRSRCQTPCSVASRCHIKLAQSRGTLHPHSHRRVDAAACQQYHTTTTTNSDAKMYPILVF